MDSTFTTEKQEHPLSFPGGTYNSCLWKSIVRHI
jgi:hypothetical protein